MTRRDMAVQTAPLHPAKEPNLPQAFEDDPEDVALQQESLQLIREWNKTLKMSIIKQSGPWELKDLPVQYRPPIPSLRRYHTPPVFILGIPLTEEDILEISRRLGRYEESLTKTRVSRYNFLLRIVLEHAAEVCEIKKYMRTVDWRVYYCKEKDAEASLFLCIARSYDPRGFRDLRELARRFNGAFPYLNKQPMWYLDALENDLEEEDWSITDIPGLSVQTTLARELDSVQDSEYDHEDIVRQEKALELIREWNKTLKMSIIKQSGPWELKDLPAQYRPPIPSLRHHHSPPFFIFGIPLTPEEIFEINRRLGTYEESLGMNFVSQNHFLRRAVQQRAEEVCEIEKYMRTVDWRKYYCKEEDAEASLFLCIARSYDPRGFRDLRELARKFDGAFPYLNKRPMWYLDALENDLEEEDWSITGIPGLCKSESNIAVGLELPHTSF
ncbi:hypothetical protein VNI00_010371 [Paramarasmius palmivorus]|uniref:Uncharacterized protein n=1 Tax=Paramarasmius palmivorus TaxID=297713 RepID=A0AAW0CJG4_9AGAR